jgi:hypothetical protein
VSRQISRRIDLRYPIKKFMKKKISVPRVNRRKLTLFTFRVEEDLKDAFIKHCKIKYEDSASNILRRLIKKLLSSKRAG